MRYVLILAALVVGIPCGLVTAQTPGVIYTWNGTGNIHDWVRDDGVQTLTNTVPGELTVVEGDPIDPSIVGAAVTIRDSYQRRREISMDPGGLDLTGLSMLEMDVAHNSTGSVNVQFFAQVTPNYTYVTGDPDGTLGRSGTFQDWTLGPGVHTLRLPVSSLTSAEQAYLIGIGMTVREHVALGNLTWTISELRSLGTSLTERFIATHDTGSTENGLNGAYVNFEQPAVMGSDGSQNQTGLSHIATGPGTLQWTDLGGGPGAAIAWGNGQPFDGNSYNERPADLSNYTHVTFRVSATGAGGGTIGMQSYFQNENYSGYQVAGVQNVPVDGAFHDLTFPLAAIINRHSVDAFGLNLFTHPNNAVINVDYVRFNTVAGIAGDYNNNGVVDTADHSVWRDNVGTTNALPNDPIGGTIGTAQYDQWKANFGKTPGAGSGSVVGAVPEPSSAMLIFALLVGRLVILRSRV